MNNKFLFFGYAASALIGVWIAGVRGAAGVHMLQSAILVISVIALFFLINNKNSS